ncbi:thiamine pyrophosphate-binding protein [Candidatus Aerophobetes bacterium]|nr:thiamine pyrophosphate-binding protein [Candidatus Aerophobetes bacterium]
MNAWEVVVNMVKSQGVEFIFGLGDTDLLLYAEKVPGLMPITVRYEGSAPFMAAAYSRLTGKPGVCSGSPGPGVANLVPGVLEAYSGCVPLVVICPTISQKTEGMGEFQECDQLGMMKPITKWSARVPLTERVPWFVNRAFSVAINGQPGPVYLEIPYDVGGHHDQVEIEQPKYTAAKRIPNAGAPELIAEAVELLLNTDRVVAVAGSGTVYARASAEFREFIELLGIPFLTTPGGRGILSEDHPLSLGLCGLYRTKVGKKIYSDASLIVSIGSRNESFQTHQFKDFPAGAKFIQIDISAFEIGRVWTPDVGIVGDAKIVLRQLVDAIKTKVGTGRNFKEMPEIKQIVKAKKEFEAEVEAECMAESTLISAKRIVHDLNKVFDKNTILVNENGSQDCWSYFFPYYKVKNGSGCVPVAEQTCMGMGVVGAIAAKLTKPEKNVVCVSGDGAFQMYMKELPTAAQYNVGCTWVVLNNSALGWVKSSQIDKVGWDTATFKIQPDFVKWAEACKCYGRRIERSSEIRSALKEALKANQEGIPAVLDFVTGIDMSHFERSK